MVIMIPPPCFNIYRKSCIMGWRLFAIIAAYCDCSEGFRPYLFKYLETVASDTQRTYSGAAAICLQNLRKTFKYGGRKNVPLKEEINALAVSIVFVILRIKKIEPALNEECQSDIMC
jgi:hypothetical protein